MIGILLVASMLDSSMTLDLGTTQSKAKISWNDEKSPLHKTIRTDSLPAAEHSVQAILQNQPGFAETMGYQAPTYLRGLGGNRLQVHLDGQPLRSSYSSGFMTHVLDVGSFSAVRFDKGLASVRYGSGSMAGTIDLQSPTLMGETGLTAKQSLGVSSSENGWWLVNSTQWSTESYGIRTTIHGRQSEAYIYGGGTSAEGSEIEESDFTLVGQYYCGTSQERWTYRSSIHRGGPWGKPRGFAGTKYLLVTTPQEDFMYHSLSYSWLPNEALEELPIAVSLTQENRTHNFLYFQAGNGQKSFEERSSFAFLNTSARIEPKWNIDENLTVLTGLESVHSTITSPMDVIDYYEGITYHARVREKAASWTNALYTEVDWSPLQKLIFRSGLRYDLARLEEGAVHDTLNSSQQVTNFSSGSGLLAMRFPLGPVVNEVRFSRTYRIPLAQEMYGQSVTGNGIIYGNRNLRAESGMHLDAAISYRKATGSITVSPYFWLLDQLISREIRAGRGVTYEYRNVGKARLIGAEVEMSHFTGLKLGWSYVYGSDMTQARQPWSAGSPLPDIPPMRAFCAQENSWTAPFGIIGIFSRLDHVFPQWRATETDIKPQGYTKGTVGMFSVPSGQLRRLRIDIQVDNIGDVNYYPFQSLVAAKGRDYRAALTLEL